MTDQTTLDTAEAVRDALDRLCDRLDREFAWVVELREDLATTERTCHRLLTSVDAAIQALPKNQRGPYLARCQAVRLDPTRAGRPPADGRQRAVLAFLAEKLDETATNAEIRLLLAKLGHAATPQYVSNLLGRWAAEGMLTRLGQGVYKVNPRDPRLQAIRFRPQDAEVRAEIEKGRQAAEARQDEANLDDEAERKAEEYQELRRWNFYNPPSEWDPNNAEYQARPAAEKG